MSGAEPRVTGPWSRERIRAHLDEARIPLRLGCVTGSGSPLVVSLWFLHREDALWAAVQEDAAVARFLRTEPRCGFEIAADAPPYRGVRGYGRASLHPARGEEILRSLLSRYRIGLDEPLARWLLSRAEREVAIRIDPERLVSWDYSARMGDPEESRRSR